MKIVEQKWALSEEDLGLLIGDPSGIIPKLMKHRVIVHFDTAPDLEELELNCNDFYYVKSLGSKLFQFWFADPTDYENFRSNLIAYKMSLNDDDK